jgi:hypothetical protein
MTCIVATRAGVWADRRVTSSNGTVWRPDRKIARNDALVAGFCGSTGPCERALRAVKAGETDPQELAKLCDGLVVDSRGVWELDSGSARRVPSRFPYAVAGSGHAEAAAFLAGAGAVDEVSVRRALRYVSRVRYDCGDGIDGLTL